MRPVRLEIEGFTAFKEKQIIDFTDVDLFAIAGPTGAGKTSVLDAMQWVLFGKVPRLSQGLSELISLGSDTARVVFDFELRGQRYQVSRSMKRRGNGQAQLDKLGEHLASLASGIRQVDGEVVRLLGLKAESFAMAVVLPQGKFARYFEASPSDRRTLMREIYGLEIFESMRSRATAETAKLATEVEVLQKQIQDAGATPEQLQAVDAELGVLREHVPVLQAAGDAAQALERELESVLRLQEALGAATQKLEAVKGRQVVEDSNRAVLEASARAESIVVPLERFEAAQKQAVEAASRLEEARRGLEDLRQKLDAANKQLKVARGREAGIAALELRLEGLRRVQEKVEEVASRQKDVQRVEADLGALLKHRNEVASRLDGQRSEREGEETRLREVEQKIEALAAGRARAEVLGVLEPMASLWRKKTLELGSLRQRWQGQQKGLEDGRMLLETLKRQRAELDAELGGLEQKVVEARRAVEAARQADLAASLRVHLHEGDACPVCEQTVTRVPAATAADIGPLEETLRQVEVARDASVRARSGVDGRIQAAENQVGSFENEAEKLHEEISKIELEIQVQCSKFVEDFGGSQDPYESFESARKLAIVDRDNYEKQIAQRTLLQQKLGHLDGRIQSDVAELSRTRDQASELESRRDEATTALTRARAALPADVPSDVGQAIVGLENEIRDIRAESERALRDETRLRASLDAQMARVEADEKAALSAVEGREAFRLRLEEVTREAGFSSVAEAQRARVDATTRKALESSIRSFEMEMARAEDEVLRLRGELGGRSTRAEAVEEARQVARQSGEHLRLELERLGRLDSERAQLARILAQMQARTEQMADVQRRHQVMSTLASDLKTNQFQNFVFQDLFKELVAGASVRMLALSQRYTLEVDDETKFFVVDQDNANEKRAIETLSGGETFLASLALALQLSQQVQDAAGSISLDSLFIDEGFGTLDPETLETVAEAVEALRDTGRVVGIITHIAELTNRLPVRLRVHKSVEGSRVEIERD